MGFGEWLNDEQRWGMLIIVVWFISSDWIDEWANLFFLQASLICERGSKMRLKCIWIINMLQNNSLIFPVLIVFNDMF